MDYKDDPLYKQFQSEQQATKQTYKDDPLYKQFQSEQQAIKQKADIWDNKIKPYIPDSTRNFLLGSVKGLSGYGSSISKLFDNKKYQDDFNNIRRFADDRLKKNDGEFAGLAGEMIADPLNLTPAGLISKGSKLARVGKSMLAGAGVGALSVGAKNYGEDDLTNQQKINEMEIGAGFVSVLNGVIAGVTKGRVTNAIKNIPDNYNNNDIASKIVENADKFGLTKDEAQVIKGEVLKAKYPKVDNEFKTEQAGYRKPYEPDFRQVPQYPPIDPSSQNKKYSIPLLGLNKNKAGMPIIRNEAKPPQTMDHNTALEILRREANRKLMERGENPKYPAVQDEFKTEYLHEAPVEKDITSRPNWNYGRQENAPTLYSDTANLERRYNQIASHPRLQELLKMRETISAKDSNSPQRLLQKGAGRELSGYGGENKYAYDNASYERNYNHDFHLTKQDIGKLYRGEHDEDLISKLEIDLDTLDNHPDYAKSFNSESGIDHKAEIEKLDDVKLQDNSPISKEEFYKTYTDSTGGFNSHYSDDLDVDYTHKLDELEEAINNGTLEKDFDVKKYKNDLKNYYDEWKQEVGSHTEYAKSKGWIGDSSPMSMKEKELMKNNGKYGKDTSNPMFQSESYSEQMSDDDWNEANSVFSKGIDNVAVGTYVGIEEDENGNITFDPEKFVLGLGGYTAVKQALKNGKVRGVLKDYAQQAIEKVDFNPEVQKRGNGFNSMFVGAKGNEKGSFSDVATKKTMREIDDSGAELNKYQQSVDDAFNDVFNDAHLSGQDNKAKKIKEFASQIKGTTNDEAEAIFNKKFDEMALSKDVDREKLFDEIDAIGHVIRRAKDKPYGKLSDYITHDELFKQYPELKDLHIQWKLEKLDGDALGSYQPKTDGSGEMIKLNAMRPKDEIKSTLLHEIQHYIQKKEGWARGGKPAMFEKTTYELRQEDWASIIKDTADDEYPVDKVIDDMLDDITKDIDNPEYDSLDVKVLTELHLSKKPKELIDEWHHRSTIPEEESFSKYKRLHGEQQARATQARADMTPEQRQSEDWTKTLARTEGEYNEPIVRYDDGVSEMSPVKSKTQKEKRGIYNVQNNDKKSTRILKDLNTVEEALKYEKGFHNQKTKKGMGALHIEKHIGNDKNGWVTTKELMNIGEVIRKVEPYEKDGKNIYEFYGDDKTRFRVVVGKDKVISFFSNRKAGKENNTLTYNYSNPSNETIIPQESQKPKGLIQRIAEQKKLAGLPEKGKKVFHPDRDKNYYLGDSGTVYFQRANGKWREMPNEEIRSDIKFISKNGVKKFREKNLENDKSLEESFTELEKRSNENSYKMEHTAPLKNDVNSRADDVSGSFSNDIYSKEAQRLHGHGNPKMDAESIATIKSVKGKPESEVTIYRAIPDDIDAGINPKDWVTTSKEYAKTHGERVLNGKYKIVEAKVKAKELYTDGNSIHEWGYDPITDPAILNANGMHSMAGGFAGGADSELNQRDYNNDGIHDFKDTLAGVGAGVAGIHGAKKLAPKLFEDGTNEGKIGAFAGDKPFAKKVKEAKAKGYQHLVKIVDEETRKEWGDASNWLKRNFTDTLGAEYHKLREDATSSTNGMSVKMERLHNALNELNETDKKLMHEYVTGENTNLSDSIKPLADNIKKSIDDLSKQLVDLEVLNKEQYDEWAGYYIHRNYEKHFFKDVKKLMSRGFKIDEIHKRGKTTEISEKQAQKMLSDVSFLASIKKPIRDGGQRLTKLPNGKYELRRDWTKEERESMNEITDISISAPETLMRLKRMVDNANFIKNIEGIDNVILKDAKKFDSEEISDYGFAKVPNNPKYGVLAGKHIRKDVLNDLDARNDEIFNTFNGKDGAMARVWKGYLSVWKKSKTVWNAPSHVNNFMSNTFLMHLSGMRADEVITAVGRAGKMMVQGNKYEELLKKQMLGKATKSELSELEEMGNDLKYFIEAKESGMLGRSQLNDILGGQQKSERNTALGKIDKFTEDAYHNGDAINRIAMYAHLRDKLKMSADESRKSVLAIMPDYSKPMPKGYRALRDTGISPFISWSYYTMPTVVKMLGTKQGAKKATLAMGTLAGLEYALTGGDITPLDNIPFINTNKPEDFKGRRFGISSNGNEVNTIKTDRWIPYVELLNPINFINSNFTGVTVNAIVNASTANSASGMVNPYYGRPITYKNKKAGQKAYDYAKYLTQSYVPLPNQAYSGWNMIESLARSKKNRRTNKVTVPRTTDQELIKNIGLNSLTYSKRGLKKEQNE